MSHLPAAPLDFWLARAAVLVIIALQLGVVNDLSLGPRWLAPVLEGALLVPLSVATAWNLGHAKRATTDRHWHRVSRQRRIIRRAAVLLTAVITVMNFGALASLVRAMLGGRAGTGQTLLIDAINIWITNLFMFALWYWNIDRGGPACRGLTRHSVSDFLFPQHTIADGRFESWRPGFVDYLFVAFTTATAFSPSDTLPLTRRAKLLMMLEAMASLVTIALVASRAVGILQ